MKFHSRRNESNNIDFVLKMISDVQKENGKTNNMREVLYDPKTMERINKFKREKLEREGVDLTEYGSDPVTKSNDKDGAEESNIRRGVFVFNEADLIDEEDGEYICEHCYKTGSGCSYKPDVCDLCHECEGCSELNSGMCDGCAYSTFYNGGMSYGQVMNMEIDLSSEDTSLFDDISNKPDYKKEKPTGHFTILDY